MLAIISGLAVRTPARGNNCPGFERKLRAEVLRGLEVVDGLGASCRQLGGDDGVRNTRNPRPYGGLSGEMRFGWLFGTISATG
jgi:hypothetical protein